jgi:transaldolase
VSIKRINRLKQSIWIDFLSRGYLESGGLESHITQGVSGVTSNPSILQKAITEESSYDKEIAELVSKGKDSIDIYEEIVRRDISIAARLLYHTYVRTDHVDGYVSIEVDPAFAHRTDATICQGAHLYNLIDSPNIMIKVPGTDEGIEAFRQLVFDGINVNVTLLFSVDQYEKVAKAYVQALQDRYKDGRSLSVVASVASFFVSRVDSYVDPILEFQEARERGIESRDPRGCPRDHYSDLLGKAAIASARIAYWKYYETFHTPEFVSLRHAGAQPQRLLWASTSTKNDPLKYVKGLIARETVNTLPPATLNATIGYEDRFQAKLEHYSLYQAEGYMEELRRRINFRDITDKLLDDGIRAFADSFDGLISSLYSRARCKKGKKHASRNPQP